MRQRNDITNQLSTGPVAVLVQSTSYEGALESAKIIAGKEKLLIAINYSYAIKQRLIPAYLNAYLRMKENVMQSNSLSIETMLFIAGSMNIGNAIKKVSANKNRFMIFSESKELANRLIKKCGLKEVHRVSLSLDLNIANEVAVTAIKDDK
ncbi:MAG: hypothetical protein KGH64_02325 [Candidatus Micrarchaeota archaeon]|nr:hypothetical protein [Candidatus Micrarchaeota archaeon]MDE1834152.1 hypothetical protein [Candidatus Micrarchaeota archaeon]MDE1859820.1 hypothetical protein [Candidatus Micrarchaeota archaeon]